MEITRDYLESMKMICQKKIDQIYSDPPKNSREKKEQKMYLFGLGGQMMLLDSLIGRLEANK